MYRFPWYLTLVSTNHASSNPGQVVITHASHVCSRHSFGLPLRMNGVHKTQFDHLSRETYGKHSVGAKAFGPSFVVLRTP